MQGWEAPHMILTILPWPLPTSGCGTCSSSSSLPDPASTASVCGGDAGKPRKARLGDEQEG